MAATTVLGIVLLSLAGVCVVDLNGVAAWATVIFSRTPSIPAAVRWRERVVDVIALLIVAGVGCLVPVFFASATSSSRVVDGIVVYGIYLLAVRRWMHRWFA